jgi:N-acetylglucosamine-6-sulfatase
MPISRVHQGRGLAVATAAALALTSAVAPTIHAAEPGRPNVVVVMTDDQDFRSMWALPKTRRLVAARGTSFATSVVNYPLCCPSRATFLTGQYAHNHGVLWNNFPEGGYYKLKSRETLPVWLRRAGYRTIHIGKYLNEYGERNPREVPPGLGRLARRRRPDHL